MAVKTKCFNCQTPTGVVIANTRPPEHKKYVCLAQKCWDTWHAKFKHD